jgi:hypothetical protein
VLVLIRVVYAIYADEITQELAAARDGGGSRLLVVIGFTGLFCNMAIIAWAGYVAFSTPMAFRTAVETVPFFWLPFVIFTICFLWNEGSKKLYAWRHRSRVSHHRGDEIDK